MLQLFVIFIFVSKNCQNSLSWGSPLWSILVCKIPEFWSRKLRDQDFVLYDSGNIHFEESKKPGFTFSNELKIPKFSGQSHGLLRPSLATSLEPLPHHQNVASFRLFYRYYFGRCSSELPQLILLPYSR